MIVRACLFLNFILISNFFASVARARVDVAFFELRNRNGELIQLEPGGRFGHVAIRVGHQWLHAVPYRGAELVDDLIKIGKNPVILSNERIKDLELPDVLKWIGLPYDNSFRWDDPCSTYCSKLVAEIIQEPPTPARFATRYWKNRGIRPSEASVGISPDDLFLSLGQKGWINPSAQPTCSALFH